MVWIVVLVVLFHFLLKIAVETIVTARFRIIGTPSSLRDARATAYLTQPYHTHDHKAKCVNIRCFSVSGVDLRGIGGLLCVLRR
ncbi:MAG TPA: hypothetical protein VEH56_02480 [Candidatus Saccharimonadales bacterium]|nr:hypothetical protein [Candidatus Saccharimonadales bacterium]